MRKSLFSLITCILVFKQPERCMMHQHDFGITTEKSEEDEQVKIPFRGSGLWSLPKNLYNHNNNMMENENAVDVDGSGEGKIVHFSASRKVQRILQVPWFIDLLIILLQTILQYVLDNFPTLYSFSAVPTFTPTPFTASTTQLLLADVGDEGEPASAFPLDECEGDCDDDEECRKGLICFQRDGGSAVLGCRGSGSWDTDYCVKPPTPNTLVYRGEGENGLLQKCAGDCDNERDCQKGLECYQRDGLEHVPGCDGVGIYAKDYCYDPFVNGGVSGGAPTHLLRWVDNDSNDMNLGICEGDCDDDDDCAWGLECYQRSGVGTVPGCIGKGVSGVDYCYDPFEKNLNYAGDEGEPEEAFPLGECQGDCDYDDDCETGLVCFQRDGWEVVPGCKGRGNEGYDYCSLPPMTNTLVYIGEDGLFQRCAGDCDRDLDCEGGLKCYKRDGYEHVPGCDGVGIYAKDYCYNPQDKDYVDDKILRWVSNDDDSIKLGECEGDCDSDSDCAIGLSCYQRSGVEEVTGCLGKGVNKVDYCVFNSSFMEPSPIFSPAQSPISPPVQPGGPTYVPGDLSVHQNGLWLSKGLTSRIIATVDETVKYVGGGESSQLFHKKPDGAAVFVDNNPNNPGGWMYTSNSEDSDNNGGVGTLTFNANGDVIDYQVVLENTTYNCGGGKTYWGTWLSCEEDDNGQVWEVYPDGSRQGRQTLLGGTGDEYESAAYDNRRPQQPKFFVTTDKWDGPLLRFTPDVQAVSDALRTSDFSEMLHKNDKKTALIEYLLLFPDLDNGNSTGTFTWVTDKSEAELNAAMNYQNSEGIDVRDGRLYFVCKFTKQLYILDLDNQTYERSSTESGAFDNQPDQVARLLDRGEPEGEDLLYFCEDGGTHCGVHGRDGTGKYFTILESDGDTVFDETTGLAFSPDQTRMYVSFQHTGLIFEITRTDGFAFGGQRLDIKYHAIM